MNEIIANAIQESITHDTISHVSVAAPDIYVAMEGTSYEDAVEAEDGIYDVWGTDDSGNDWRLYITIK